MGTCVRTIRDQIVGMMGMVGIKWVAVHKIGSSLTLARQRASSVAWVAENKAKISFKTKGMIMTRHVGVNSMLGKLYYNKLDCTLHFHHDCIVLSGWPKNSLTEFCRIGWGTS